MLPDILGPSLRAVFCGTAVGQRSLALGHYYAGPQNEFWQLLHQSGLTPRRLTSAEDRRLLDYGLGLTDLVKGLSQSHDRGLTFDVVALVAKLQTYEPRWIAFTSKTAGHAAARHLRHPKPHLGVQRWNIAKSRVVVLPSPSGANRRKDYEGKPSRIDWWAELAVMVRPSR